MSIARRGGKSIFHAALDPMVARVDKAKRNAYYKYICTPKYQMTKLRPADHMTSGRISSN